MTTTTVGIFVIWVTALYPHIDHAVTDEEMAARNTESRGEYHGVCGAEFLPAPDNKPPGQRCPACAQVLRARNTLPALEQQLSQPAGWWPRLRRGGRQ